MQDLELLKEVSAYIEAHLERPAPPKSRAAGAVGMALPLFHILPLTGHMAEPPTQLKSYSEQDEGFSSILNRLEDSFSTLLIKYIRQKGLSNAEVYKEANLDRRLFSKIISNSNYAPAKSTVLALVIALRLNLDEAATLLKSAGFALSHSSRVDLVVEYFIQKGGREYNIFQINDVLMDLNLPQFGSKSWSSD